MEDKKVLAGEIYEFFKGKLIWQFRKPKWETEYEFQLNKMISEEFKGDLNRNYLDGYSTGSEFERLKFKNHIPKPSTNFKNRIKFLFTGKF